MPGSAVRSVADAPAREQVAEVADTIVHLLRSFGRARARMIAAAESDVEWSAHVLLRALNTDGPMRASALAECLQSDPSTVSRQVATLVRDGLLERQADPVDGRASLLVLTPRAHDVLAEHNEIRLDFFADVLRDWTPGELDTFAGLLQRFTTDYETTSTTHIPERMAARATRTAGSAPAGGTDR